MNGGDGANWYAYCANNPLAFVDPTGLLDVPTGTGGYVHLEDPVKPKSPRDQDKQMRIRFEGWKNGWNTRYNSLYRSVEAMKAQLKESMGGEQFGAEYRDFLEGKPGALTPEFEALYRQWEVASAVVQGYMKTLAEIENQTAAGRSMSSEDLTAYAIKAASADALWGAVFMLAVGGGSTLGQGLANATNQRTPVTAPGKVPNPYGKLGGPAHQGKITEIADDLISKGYEVSFEKYVKTAGGFKDARFGDIFVKNPTTGESWIINVGKGTKGGFPISREWKALEDLMNQGYTVQFEPYNLGK